MTSLYPYTDADVDAAFNTLSETHFATFRDADCADCDPSPSLLIVAGAQGSGKTYLLEHTLLPSGRYQHYVRLYLPAFRMLHPHYLQMSDKGVLHVYEHTERFIWALCAKVHQHAFENRYNIIMETALDDPEFARFPIEAVQAGYRFEVHMIACQADFRHWATLDRGVKGIASGEIERFVAVSNIETSENNAKSILDAFEYACTQIVGSQITLYHRGIETRLESRPLCHSRCDTQGELAPQADYLGQPFSSIAHVSQVFEIRRSVQSSVPSAFVQYAQIVHAGMVGAQVRQEMVKLCCKTLGRAKELMPRVPADVFRELCLYVLKYIYP